MNSDGIMPNMGTAGANKSNAAPQEDYVDKGLDSVERKTGQDPGKLRQVNEKVTDAARGMFEKATGKHVPDKVSN